MVVVAYLRVGAEVKDDPKNRGRIRHAFAG
jgi:hypothetical protein